MGSADSQRSGGLAVSTFYHILFHHWVHDDTVYRDEQQRSYVATGILMTLYFGCRPVSMFDTRIKFENEDDTRRPADNPTVAGNPEDHSDSPKDQGTPNDMDWDDEQATLVNSSSDPNQDNNASEGDDDDSDTDSDSGTGDGVDTGLDNTVSPL